MPSQAPVEWWDCSSMYVRCPGCDKIHRHSFDGNYEIKHRRASHCDSLKYHCGTYDILSPLQYEIDKERALFVAAGSDPTKYFAEKNAIVWAPAKRSDVRRWEEATEKFYAGEDRIELDVIDSVFTEMATGNVEYVRDYIESSSESDIFLHVGTGDTALHLAARGSHPEINRVLLQKGADPNVLNFEGRTPLAEAALWGRLENVRILLENGADKTLECFRSGQCLRAIDFAKPTDANDEERNSRSRHGYKEDACQRKIDRREIVRLLEDDTETIDAQNHALSGFAFTKTPGQETWLTLLAHFDVPKTQKTIAVLHRGDRFDLIAAMSGWAHEADDRVNIQIAGRDWTSDVLRLCKISRHDLVLNHYDQGVPGQYDACHAEKQLIAYFINKHCFLQSELATHAGPDDECHEERLSELHCCAPPFGLKTATIMVSRPVCGGCKPFVSHINRLLGLKINVISSSPCSAS
ncbi:DYW family of nucleic acid deaminases-domain-containing protein [Ustulina deusta]|nr:DYW family of nucleic acid deaminases-domain-containing protein [Ustulina deusta]